MVPRGLHYPASTQVKLLAVAVLVLATTACTAQQSPVGIAVELYKGCMVGFSQAMHEFPSKPAEIETLAYSMDKECTSWTYIWLPTMLHKDRPELRPEELIRFEQHKRSLLASYIKEVKDIRK